MTPERWRQVDRILEEALELPPDERVGFLDRVCSSDHALRRDVEAVLQAHRNAGTFLDKPALAVAAKQLAVDERKGLVGRTLGHYRILSLIGAGGMGEVYRASDPRLGREVAVKVLPEHLAQNPEALARFEREAKVVATLSHPNILAIHDVGEEQGVRYAVMEFLDGETLRDLLNKSRFEWRDAVTIGAAVADGLAAAHAKEIVHRDLKPENIFRTSDGRIKILDFGLARTSGPMRPDASPTQGTITEPWMVLGTVGYMSPEQVRGAEANAPSDIFSLGCVLYEMVTGKRAYARQTTAETMAAIVQGEMPDSSELSRRASPELQQLIVRCLQKNPASRYTSARDLCQDLNALLGRSQMHKPAAHARGMGLNWIQWIAAAASIVLILVLGYVWWRGRHQPSLIVEKQRLVFTAPSTYGAASFSPDCGMITYTQAAVDGIPHVFVKNLSGGDPIQITFADVAANRPQWSPRNDQIVFSAGPVSPAGAPPIQRDQSIWSVPPLGGTPRKLIEGAVNANWSRDGNKLVFERGTEIWIADADGTNQHKVDGIPPVGALLIDHMPSLSPDGSLIAYFQAKAGAVLGDFWVVPAAGGQPRRLTSDVVVGRSPAWSPDGKYVVVASQRSGSLTLWKIPVMGGSPEPMLSGAGDDSDPEICGDRLVYRHTRQAFALTLLDPLTNKTRELRSSTDQIVAPSFSPNGDRIAFFSHEHDGEIQLFTVQPDGGGLTQITSGKGEQNTFPQWSEDGAYLYYYQAKPVTSFRRIPVTGGPSLEIEHGWNWGTQNSAQVAPGGERLVYSLTKESDERTAVVRYLDSGKEEVLNVGLSAPRWSSDGKSVLGYLRMRGGRDGNVLICPAQPGACEKLTSGYNPRWSSDDSIIYFLRFNKSSDGGDLYRMNRKTRVETRVAVLRPLFSIVHMYDISPQGEIVYVQYNSGVQELWLADLKH